MPWSPAKNMENNSQNSIGGMPNKIWIIIGVLLVVAVIVVAATTSKKTGPAQPSDEPAGPTTGEEMPGSDMVPEEAVEEEVFNLEGAVIEASGSNPILDNKVITMQGEVVQSDLPPLSPGAPQQSNPVAPEALSGNVIKVNVSTTGFEPNQFTVKADSPVSISFTSMDQTHVFKFDDPSLKAVAVGIGSGETRVISFNAPESPGEYTFRCDVPGHARRGEVGKMIVQ